MSSLLATVIGPHGTIDVDLPADATIESLVPLLVDVCAPQYAGAQWARPEYWVVALADGQPLPHGRSLADCGVLDGAILLFRDAHTFGQSPPAHTPQADGYASQRDASASGAPEHAPAPTFSDPSGVSIRWNKDALLS